MHGRRRGGDECVRGEDDDGARKCHFMAAAAKKKINKKKLISYICINRCNCTTIYFTFY